MMNPIFSVLLVVNNDIATIAETLDSVLKQDYKYYEVIIIDNASTDGSNKICKDAVAGKENVIFKKLYSKVTNADAWNMALDMAQGQYVSFLKGNDWFFAGALSSIWRINERQQTNITHLFAWIEEDARGEIFLGGKKFIERRDAHFQKTTDWMTKSSDGVEALKFLNAGEINRFLGTKFFKHEFLLDKGIKFDEQLADDKSEFFFQMECFLKADNFVYVGSSFYVAPKKSA